MIVGIILDYKKWLWLTGGIIIMKRKSIVYQII